MNGFSIIVPTYNRAELLRQALMSIQGLTAPTGWNVEILVVDNNCTDNTAEVIMDVANHGQYSLRHIVEMRQGLNHGRNRGIVEAQFEHLVYLDDDMTIASDWLVGYTQALQIFHADAVTGPVDPVFEEPPAYWVTDRMLQSVTSAYSQKGNTPVLLPTDRAHELPGCNFAVRRQVALSAGGFHPSLDRSRYGMLAGGDWEFGQRLAWKGHRIVYSPTCRVRHLVSRSKLSKEGMRARWEGIGSTKRVMEGLRGDERTLGERLRLALRMGRFYGRALRYRLVGNERSSFHWELEALRLKGYLFHGASRTGPCGNIEPHE